jgi:outer membrane lipoprotein carrier protein
MMRQRVVLVFALVCSVMAPGAQADTAKERLLSFFKDVKSMQAEFTQIVKAQGFDSKDTSKGLFRLLRPGKFRWDYDQPYKQEIIADGSKLWIYDMDMDQVIVKPLNLVLGQTPAVLLSGTASLTDRFEIEDRPDRHDLHLKWVLLTPKDKDSSYEKLLLGFGKDTIEAMELVDNFGQVTLLQFSHVQRNPKIDPKVFAFKPPAGVDVIGDEETNP